MGATVKKVTISDFRNNMKKYTDNPAIEVALTLKGKPIGAYVGIDTWRSTQKTLDLLREHPDELLRSLVLHQRLKKTGKAEGISLKDFTESLNSKLKS